MMTVGLPDKQCPLYIGGTPKRIRIRLYRLMVRNRRTHPKNRNCNSERFEWRVSSRNPLHPAGFFKITP